MCRTTKASMAGPPRHQLSLLLSSSSFHCTDEKKEKGPLSPAKKSVLLTVGVYILFFILSEQLVRYLITTYMQDTQPLLELERHRHILARHIGVDALACFMISYLGFINRHELYHIFTLKRSAHHNNTYLERIFDYQPEAHRILLIFISYQAKNTYDTIKWNDGAIFVAHHIFAGMTAWFGMYPGVAGVYGLFFMGMSEISTCVLCLLANFDPQLGVDGLADAFPLTKVVLGVIFCVLFIVFRVFLWPIFSYHFLLDSMKVLKRDSVKETKEVRMALKMMVGSNFFLTALQIAWLGEIIMTAKEEISAFMI
jgi:hypothetical protein